MPTWPTIFPQDFLEQGYRRRSSDPLLRSAIDSGPPKTRPRFTGNHGVNTRWNAPDRRRVASPSVFCS